MPSGWSRKTQAAMHEAASGFFGRILIARRPPKSAPPLKAAVSAAHAGAPPSSRLAITGPRTQYEANAKLPIPKKTIVVQIHVCRRNSPQPWRRSAKNDFASTTSARRGSFSGTSSSAPSANEAASMSSADPGLPAATMAPPIAGPTILVALRESPSRAFACCRRGGLTVAGIRPVDAGR